MASETVAPASLAVYEPGVQELVNASVQFGGQSDLVIEQANNEWKLGLDLDIERQELIFTVDVKPNTWLAVGLADDLLNADVI